MKFTFFALLAVIPFQLPAADTLTYDQQEAFLRSAKIVKQQEAKKGVTGTVRVTLSDGKTTHDASVQKINDHKMTFQGSNGASELNFKDTYMFDIAGWKLAKLLGIEDMVPVSVERKYKGDPAAYTWWVDDVLMDEADRTSKKVNPPDQNVWNKEIQVMHIYDQLMYNTDSNATNLLIDKQWHIWMIDHSRAFRMYKTLQDPKAITSCDRNLLAKMKALDAATLQKEMKGLLDKGEIQGLLTRRDVIVKMLEAKGDSALYDRPARQ